MSTTPQNRVGHLLREPGEAPKPRGCFTDSEALDLMMQYRANPAALRCPGCQTPTVEVIAFVHPEVMGGHATVVQPEGEYAAILMCMGACRRSIGILANLEGN